MRDQELAATGPDNAGDQKNGYDYAGQQVDLERIKAKDFRFSGVKLESENLIRM